MMNGKATITLKVDKLDQTRQAKVSAMVIDSDDKSLIGLSGSTSIMILGSDAGSGQNGQDTAQTVKRDISVLSVEADSTYSVIIRFSDKISGYSRDNVTISGGVEITGMIGIGNRENGVKAAHLRMKGAEHGGKYVLSITGWEQNDGGVVQGGTFEFVVPQSESNENVQPNVKPNQPKEESPKTQKITYQTKAIKKGEIAYGAKFSLGAKSSGKCTLSYQSSDQSILSVDQEGRVIAKGYGKASITVRAAAENGYRAASKKIKLVVVPDKLKVIKQDGRNFYFEWNYGYSGRGYTRIMSEWFLPDKLLFTSQNKNAIVSFW